MRARPDFVRGTDSVAACNERPLRVTTFSDFQLNPAIVKSLAEEGYTDPTPIQSQAIPSVLSGKDLLGIAQTGTGKTAAFALPILHRLAATKREPMRRGCRVLVLSPTRELASQIADSFRTYGRYLGIRVAVVFGGVGHAPQREALTRGVDVLVATPGRLLDHIGERNVVLDGVEMFVLDEADQMLDMGFIRPIRQIVAKLSSRRQSLFFSATMPKEIGHLASELLRDPVKVSVTPSATTVERVRQHVYLVDARAKRSLLVELFANPELTRTLVFTRTKRGADRVAQHLAASGISVAAIHGNKSQNQREAALAQFKVSKIRVLVATDVAARGIDIDLVTHVVNYELPNVPESYVHRIGRTARAGAEGIAISLCDAEERDYLRDIERLTRQSIETTDRRRDPSLELAAESARESRGGRRQSRGHGPSGKPKAHNGERHGRPDTRGSRGRPHRGGGHDGRGGADVQDGRSGDPRPVWDSRDQPHRGSNHDSRSAADAQARHNGKPRSADARPDTRGSRGRPHRGGGGHERRNGADENRHGGEPRPIENVAFLATPGRSGRPDHGNRPSPRNDGGEQRRQSRPHQPGRRNDGAGTDRRHPNTQRGR
jgi:ATP-dependent RNA helicase RhlE